VKKLGAKIPVLLSALALSVLAILYATREPSADGRTLALRYQFSTGFSF
jgi:hypothetical protein